MRLKKCLCEIRVVRKKGRHGNMRPASDLGKRNSKMVRSNLPELLPSTSMIVIRWVSNGKDIVLAPKQLQTSYTDERHWDERIDFIYKHRG